MHLTALSDLTFMGIPVQHIPRCASTMDLVAAAAAHGAPEGTCITTDAQTAGRGRAGRVWTTPPGSAILLSVLLKPRVPPKRLSQLSILVASCCARLVESHCRRAAVIKWPNDVLVDGWKISGVLANGRVSTFDSPEVILGIGLNINIAPDDLPPRATSLRALAGHTFDRAALLGELLPDLESMYRAYLTGDISTHWRDATRRLAYRGEHVQIVDGDVHFAGTLIGLAPSGALRLRLVNGTEREIWSGDLVRGPRPIGDQRAQTC